MVLAHIAQLLSDGACPVTDQIAHAQLLPDGACAVTDQMMGALKTNMF